MFNNSKEKFALRKLSVGLTSVLIGVSLISIQNSEVKADTTSDKTVQKIAEKKTTDVLTQQEKVVQTVSAQNKTVETTENEKTPQMAPAQVKQVADAQDAGQIKTPKADTHVVDTGNATDTPNQTGIIKQKNMLNVKTNKIAMVAEMASANKVDVTANVKNYTPDVKSWAGQVVSNKDLDGVTRTYYELTGYTPNSDAEKTTIIIPNQDDFTKAGINIGYQTMIKSDTIKNLNKTLKPEEWHFSDTNEKKTVLIGSDYNWFDSIQNKYIQYHNSANNMLSESDNLKAVTGNGLDTSNIEDMNSMFESDSALTDISGLSMWNVSHVVNLSRLFTSDSSLTNLDALSNWDISKNTTLSYSFAYMKKLSSIEGLRNWDTGNVTAMNDAFEGLYYTTKTPDPRSGADWTDYDLNERFTGYLQDYSPLQNWNTSKVRDMSLMFQGSDVKDASFVTNWDTHNVENVYAMFMHGNISDVTPFAKWDLTGIKNHNINEMLSLNMITDLTPLRNWNVVPGENLESTFNSNNIRYADLTQIKASQVDMNSESTNRAIIVVKNIPDSFDYMLTKEPNLSIRLHDINYSDRPNGASFTMGGHNKIQISNGMAFEPHTDYDSDKTHRGKIDLCTMPVFYASKATTADDVKQDVRQQILKNIQTKLDLYRQVYNLPATKDIVPVTPLDQITDLADLSNAHFKVVDRTLPELDTNDEYALNAKNDLHEHANVNDNGGYDIDTWGTLDISKFTVAKDGTNLEITGYNGDLKNVIIPNIADFWVKGQDQGCSAVEISSDTMKKIAKNAVQIGLSKSNNEKVMAKDTDWFDAFGGGTNKHGETNNQNGGLYIYNPNLIKMDLHNLNTSRIVGMNSMFNGARNVTTLGDLSQWDTSHANDMGIMFQECNKISDLGNLDNWQTGNVTKMNYMFNNMYALTNLGDLSRWNTAKVTNMSHMFSVASKLSNIGNLNTWQTGNVQTMRAMFNECYVLTNIGDLSNWNTSKVTDMQFMFYGCHLLNTVGNLSQWNTSNVTSMKSMFEDCNSIINLGNLNKWDTHNVTDMHWMFSNMAKLESIGDISNWNVSNVTNMSTMFKNDSRLTHIGDLNNWDTHNVTDMQWMFANMAKLESIGDISNWDVSNVTSMSTMFQNDLQLTHIGDLSHWNTSKVTAMEYMFFKDTSLKDLNISNWNLSALTDRDSFRYFVAYDTNLTVIANDIKLPNWYNNELANSDYFWNNYMAVITNNPLLLKSVGDVDDIKIHVGPNTSTDSRSIFYSSDGSNDAVAVLNKYNSEYINNYVKNHLGYGLKVADNVDKTDPISLANANFITIDVPLTITFVDKTDKDKTVPATLTINGQGTYTLTTPIDYELVGTLPTMYYGQNYTIEVKHVIDHNTVNDNATRTFILHLPNGTIQTIVQTIGLTRNQDYDRAIKKIISQTPWVIVTNTSNVTIDGKVDNGYKAFEENTNKIRFAPITLPKMLGYKPVIRKNATNPTMLMISFVALPTVETKPQVPSAPTVINKNDKAKTDNSAVADKKQVDWYIDQKVDSKTSYTVTNDQIAIKLPKLPDQVLNIIKTSDYTLAFNYLRLNKTNDLIFSIKYNKHGYVLSVLGKHGEIVKMIKCKSYDDLVKILFKLNR